MTAPEDIPSSYRDFLCTAPAFFDSFPSDHPTNPSVILSRFFLYNEAEQICGLFSLSESYTTENILVWMSRLRKPGITQLSTFGVQTCHVRNVVLVLVSSHEKCISEIR